MKTILALLILSTGAAAQTVAAGAYTFTGAIKGLSDTVANIPATCTQGQIYFATNATVGTNIYLCTSANVWTQMTIQDRYKTFICPPGLGDGLNAISAGTYLQSNCFNLFGSTYTITGVYCYTDNNGTSTLNITNGAGTALLTGAITCTNTIPGAAGTQSATVTIVSNDGIKFTFVADGTSKQTAWGVKGTR